MEDLEKAEDEVLRIISSLEDQAAENRRLEDEVAELANKVDAKRKEVDWAANKKFNIVKFKFKFPIARTFELLKARSRLYRSQHLQVNTRSKALAEIYTMHSFAPFFNLRISAKNRQHFFAIE